MPSGVVEVMVVSLSIWTGGALVGSVVQWSDPPAGCKADDVDPTAVSTARYGCTQRGHAGDLDLWLEHACGVKLTARVTGGRIAARKSSNPAVSRCCMWA